MLKLLTKKKTREIRGGSIIDCKGARPSTLLCDVHARAVLPKPQSQLYPTCANGSTIYVYSSLLLPCPLPLWLRYRVTS